MPWQIEEMKGEFCVVKEGSDTPISGGCHSKRADAVKHMQALYANEPSSMKYSVLAFTDSLLEETDDPNVKWLKAWRYSKWEHPKYGTVEITPEMGMEFKQHFDSGTFGRDPIINYDHGIDAAKGGKAAGVILDIAPKDDGIYYKVQFTESALAEIKAGEWKYLSPEFYDWYIDKETQDSFENVPADLALTNQPFFKGMPPLNFSEMYDEKPEVKEKVPVDKPKGGSEVDELLRKFAEKLGVAVSDDDTEDTLLAKADKLNETIAPLRDAKKDAESSRTFREAFPDQYEKIQKLEAAAIETDAMSFADGYSRFTIRDGESNEFKSVLGFSELVKEKIAEVHRKFSERSATHKDLKSLLDLIGDKGIVDYSEHGSNRTDSTREFSEDPRLAFSEAVQDVMEKDNLSYEDAIRVAAQKFPKLYEEYFSNIPQR
jgi:hypothetical protein